jgi:hypothetical protein
MTGGEGIARTVAQGARRPLEQGAKVLELPVSRLKLLLKFQLIPPEVPGIDNAQTMWLRKSARDVLRHRNSAASASVG